MYDFYLEKSSRKNKKYMVSYINEETGNVNTIYFGGAGYSDYILSNGDIKKKENYIKRHQKNEDWNDLKKAGAWSRFILWNLDNINASIKDMEKKFNIKIWLI